METPEQHRARVRAWKRRNPDKLKAQRQRALERERQWCGKPPSFQPPSRRSPLSPMSTLPLCTFCQEHRVSYEGRKTCEICHANAGDLLERYALLYAQAPALLTSCLALIEELEAMEQAHGISALGASRLHEAKIATLNAQGITEEGYNA